jgi:hypothetical protein
METINVTKKTKDEFEKDRFQLRLKSGSLISQEDFMIELIKCWRCAEKQEKSNGK